MIWKKISIYTTNDVVDLMSDFLAEIGIEGIEIEDSVPLTDEEIKAMYVDIPIEKENVDNNAIISCYIDDSYDDEAIADLKSQISEELDRLSEFFDVGDKTIATVDTSDDSTWNDNWKKYYKPIRLYDDIVILPTWMQWDEIRDTDHVINIESVMAFGTGSHETTRLCIGELKKYISADKSVFDIGCGSGILSIAAVLLGAGYVHGIDIDPQAVESSKINAKANDLTEDRIDFSCGNLLAGNKIADNYIDKYKKASLGSRISTPVTPAEMVDLSLGGEDSIPARRYDIVVANILADVIIPLADIVAEYLEPDGTFIASGISLKRRDDVLTALKKNNFDIIDVIEMGEWCVITSKQSK